MSQAITYSAPDYLERFDAAFEHDEILRLRDERRIELFDERNRDYRSAVEALSTLRSDYFDFADAAVTIGKAGELSPQQRQTLLSSLKVFRPWKKGPFQLFGIDIDAEWRSDWKWERIVPFIAPLTGRRVADIGCHNGYFMFRMAHQQPACVIGFEPVAKHFWNFQLLQNIVRSDNLTFELLGVEHLHLYPTFFDTIFCLGILYHHTDPVSLLRKLRHALAPAGEIIIDCQGIPGDLAVALTPRKRYANARGVWFLPTRSCLENWLLRAGFHDVRCFFAEPLSVEEQRRTAWADIDSLQEFLDADDPALTIEGYPAPWRFYVRAQKKAHR
jgi:tRNA (mo5U34)-methyltransferase